MKRSTLQSANKERFTFMYASLVGRKVTVNLRSLVSYEGLFDGTQTDKGEQVVLLKHVRELASDSRASGPVQPQLLISAKEIVTMVALDVPEGGVDLKVSSEDPEFKTDTEINVHKKKAAERNLESWADLEEDAPHQALESTGGWANGTDQFAVAERMGVVSTYKEDLYTTPLDYSRLTTEQRSRAEKVAREIEGGRNFASQEEAGGDEEAMFSAVIGTGGYKKKPVPVVHPVNTASSWRRSEETDNRNTRLNALNLEPASTRQQTPPVKGLSQIPTRASAPPSSEMKGINALNLEPASRHWEAGKFRAGKPAPAGTQPTKKDFEIALEQINIREKGGATPPKRAAVPHSFSFNPNASTFTPGPPAGNTLSIAITPNGSLSGTLKSGNYEEPHMMPPQMGGPMMPPMMPPMMGYMQPPPIFAPLVEQNQVEKVSVASALDAFVKKSARINASSESTSWSSESTSYKDILGPAMVLPPGGMMPMGMMPPAAYGMPYYPPTYGGRPPRGYAPYRNPRNEGYQGHPPHHPGHPPHHPGQFQPGYGGPQ